MIRPSGLEPEGFHLRKKEILRGRTNLERLFSKGRRYKDPTGTLKIVVLSNGHRDSRFCFGVGRVQGKSHDRNYVRRTFREIIRTHRAEIPPGMDFCLIPVRTRFRTLDFARKKELILSSLIAATGPSR